MDQLTDMIIRIKNGQKHKRSSIILYTPVSKLCIQFLKILQNEGYIEGYNIKKIKPLSVEVYLKYTLSGLPTIKNITRISKPSHRIYVKSKSLWNLNSGIGIFILSTPQGLMTDLDAKIINQGGEVLCSIL